MTEPLSSAPVEFTDVALGLNVPPSLQSSIERHRAHLAQLVISLRAAAVPEAQIAASITTLSASYRAELINVLTSMMKADHGTE